MIGCKQCGYEGCNYLFIRVRSNFSWYQPTSWDYRAYAKWEKRYKKYRIMDRWVEEGPLKPTLWCGTSGHRNPIPQKLWRRDRIWIEMTDVAKMMNLL